MTFKIAVIKPNEYKIDDVRNLSIEQIKNDIQDYIEFIDVNTPNEMMEQIVTYLKQTHELLGDCSLCYNDINNIYQMCFLSKKDNHLDETEPINGLASYFTDEGREIYGNTVMMNSLITDNGTCTTGTLSLDDIVNILYKRSVHKGSIIKTDGTVNEITFYSNPLEDLSKETVDNYRYIELPLFKFNLIAYIQLQPTNNVINKKATRLVGSGRVFGDIIIASRVSDYSFGDLDTALLEKILFTCCGSMESRDLTKDEEDTTDKINGLNVIRNKYRVLNNRYEQYTTEKRNNLCSGCNKEFEKLTLCTGCYRTSYHNKDCQKSHWKEHKNNCPYGNESINELFCKSIKEKEEQEKQKQLQLEEQPIDKDDKNEVQIEELE